MELKELVGEEVFKQIETKLNGHTVIIADKDEKYIKDDGTYIPKVRFNEVIEQKNTYKETNEELNKQLGNLKKQLEGNAEVEKQINQLQNDLKERDDKVSLITKKYALKDALRDTGARYPDLLMSKFELSSIQLTDEGKIKDFDSKFEPIKKEYPDLFGKPKIPNTDGDGPGGEPPKVNLTPQQKKEAHEKFSHLSAEKAEEAWFEVLKRAGKIK